MPNWDSYEFQIEGRLVRLATGDKTQTVNVCTKENVLGRYEVIYELGEGCRFFQPKDFGGCYSLEGLARLVQSRGGEERKAGKEPGSGS